MRVELDSKGYARSIGIGSGALMWPLGLGGSGLGSRCGFMASLLVRSQSPRDVA